MGAEGFHRFGSLDADWPVVRLRAVAKHRSEWVSVADDREYLRVTARTRNQGVELRDRVSGDRIMTKRQQLVRGGDLLVAEIDAKVGGFGLVPGDLDGAVVSSHYFLFEIDNSKLTQSWLDQFVRAGKLQRQVDAVGSTNYASIRPQDVLTFQIPLPDVEEQLRASAILDATDEAITRTQRLIDALAVNKHAAMRELLTKGHPKHKTKLVPLPESWPVGRIASTIGKMPSHWKLVTLTKIAKLESGHTPSRKEPDYWNGDIPWLSLPDSYRLDEIEVNDADGRISALGIANSSARMLPVGSVLLIRTGGSRGKCSRLATTMACSQDYVAFVPGPELDSRYLQQVFRHMQREWQRLSDGSTTLRNIFMHAFKRLKILVPPLDEQAAIADVGEAFDLRIAAEVRYLEQLRQTKRGLAQALLSGRVRVGAGKANSARASGVARSR